MFHFSNRRQKSKSTKTSARRRSVSKSLQIEQLENRVVYSTSAVSVPAAATIVEGDSYKVPITRNGDLSKPVTLKYSFFTETATNQDISRGTYSNTVTLKPGIQNY